MIQANYHTNLTYALNVGHKKKKAFAGLEMTSYEGFWLFPLKSIADTQTHRREDVISHLCILPPG